jgi:hypothetical protein
MGALYGATADVERRAVPGVSAKGLDSYSRANDIDNSVFGTDLVKVDRLGIAIVNLALGLGEQLERLDSERLRDRADGSVGDDLPNLLEAAMNVGFVRWMGGCVLVSVRLVLMSVSPMLVLMLVFVRMWCVEVERLVSVTMDEDIDLGCSDSTAFDTMGYQLGIHAETAGNGLQFLQRDAGIYGCAEKHVAADSRETVEVGNTHWESGGRLPEFQV